MKTITIADLFCGAGGTSEGALQALRALGYTVNLTAINHWPTAVATHSANHPNARHLCASLDSLNPRDLFKPGELDLLWASPECTHHSIARGGKPINDQSRATAWCVIRWAEALTPSHIFVENVPEFLTWGPTGSNGRPLTSRKGETFRAWKTALESIGYKVDFRILCAADYGDPTTRKRLFVQAVRGRRRIVWPNQTHAARPQADLFTAERKPWRAAKEIIDFSLPSRSIYERKRPLAPKTLARIRKGLEKYGPRDFVIAWDHQSGNGVWQADRPLSAITTKARHGVVQPFIVKLRGTNDAADIDKPLPTITAGGTHLALAEPFLIPQQSGGAPRPVTEPLPTIATAGAIGLVQPFLVNYYGNGDALDVNAPLDTVTTKSRFALCEPEIIEIDGQKYMLDIRFRMLEPHECARAHSFPDWYTFTGTKTEVFKQIGNSVPCGLARALVKATVSQNPTV